jgi:hypothetical protein
MAKQKATGAKTSTGKSTRKAGKKKAGGKKKGKGGNAYSSYFGDTVPF